MQGIPKTSGGFTMVEMVTVMLILGILALIAVPRLFDALCTFRVHAAAHKLVGDVRYARELALGRRGTYGIEVNIANNFYTVFSFDENTNQKTTLTDPHTQGQMIVDFDTLPGYAGIGITAADLCDSLPCSDPQEIRFDQWGEPYDINGVKLATISAIVLDDGNGIWSGGNTGVWSTNSSNCWKAVQISHETGYSEIV